MIGPCESNRRGRPITRPLEYRLRILGDLCTPYARIADVGAGQGRLSRRLEENGSVFYATERTPRGVRELQHYLAHTSIRILEGDGLGPLVDQEPFDAVVLAGMGRIVIEHILEQRQQLAYRPRFVIQVVQGMIAIHRYLRKAEAVLHGAQLTQERGRIYATWVVSFPSDATRGDWEGLGLLQEFCGDPLWIAVCGHEAEIRQAQLVRPLSDAERLRIQEEWQYWQGQLLSVTLDR